MRPHQPSDRADWTAIAAIVLGGLVGLIAFALMMPWSDLEVDVDVRMDTDRIEQILP
jgi:hypothetical protein